MRPMDVTTIAAGTGGRIAARSEDPAHRWVTAVSIDSRAIPEQCLFFCVIGERVDAHRFLPDVREKGCHNVVISDPVWAEKLREYGDMNVVLVEDTTQALMDLAEYYMDRWTGIRKIGVTGSVGKTGTKEFVSSVLKSRYRTGKTAGNLNSEFGVPLTVFSLDPEIEAAVIEMGTGYGGHIAELTKIVKPDAAVITNVGTSHLEVFGTRTNLLQEKLHIANGFGPDNTLIINADSDLLTRENVRRYQQGGFHLITVGSGADCDFRIHDIEDLGVDGVRCVLTVEGEDYELALPVAGAHNLGNAAEAVAAGTVYGIPVAEGIRALQGTEAVKNRLHVIRTGRYTIINDTYNASPESMKAGIEVLMHSKADRRIAVLGDMFELGDDTEALHASVGAYAAASGLDLLMTVGKLSAAIAEAAKAAPDPLEILRYEDRESAAEALKQILRDGDAVLVKASNGMALDKLVEAILE
ncbi:MAG: UDP-N-acetylmuramoyl-tripeptide--D-alanyl-D-alanine ligase [Mogibacterium sp.]|nr:UDP-N-acetylmuramoyl-tripeptide--D-alanyl-D-alanine ligase [Mogibacterium sp.]